MVQPVDQGMIAMRGHFITHSSQVEGGTPYQGGQQVAEPQGQGGDGVRQCTTPFLMVSAGRSRQAQVKGLQIGWLV